MFTHTREQNIMNLYEEYRANDTKCALTSCANTIMRIHEYTPRTYTVSLWTSFICHGKA